MKIGKVSLLVRRALTGRGKPLATLCDVGLVELLEFRHFVESDVVGMMRHVRLCDACIGGCKISAMFMSQGHIMAAEWVRACVCVLRA